MSEANLNKAGGKTPRQFVDEDGKVWNVGRHAARLRRCSNVVTIDEDLRDVFPTERAVNDALRALASTWPTESRKAPTTEGGFSREDREKFNEFDKPSRTVVIHNDVHRDFPNAEAVNKALHATAKLASLVEVHRVA